ncbi:MAG: ATP-binding protein, partial [Gammaproteobacteria bacterium]|nr:ATP-binding protein [Gammaproteobacteria bacterium]
AIEAGQIELSIEAVPLLDTINETISLINSMIDKAHIELQILVDSVIVVQADHTKLKQVLLNLISNAIKYNREGGSITIYSCLVNNNRVRISITDTGIGIPEASQAKVFSSFHRLGHENSTIEGTGIGLVVTKNLVELMGGSIGFESQENIGTTFWFELALADQESQISAASINNSIITMTDNSGYESEEVRHILYVEDNAANRQLMRSYFNRLQHSTLHFAETAELALEMLLEKEFDLILMDIHLPGMDGKELTRYLKEMPEFEHTPIIAVTAAAMAHDIESAENLFESYITKPIDFSDLDEQIKKHLPVG